MSQIKVKVEYEDEHHPLSRSLSLSTGIKTITTPQRAFHLKQDTTSESRLIQNDFIRGINEIYHELTKEKIEEIDSNFDKLQEWGKKLRCIFTMPKIKDEFNMLFCQYKNKNRKKDLPNRLPSDQEIEYLCNIVTHPASEVIIPPMIPDISGSEYLKFIKKFFSRLKSYRKKQSIMANIPMIATNELRELNQFYFEQGINMFSVDFNRTHPMDSYILVNEIRKLTNAVSKEFKEDSYLHAFNVPHPKSQPSTDIAPAKDMLTLASGFDSFGTIHKREKRPPEVVEKIKQKIEQSRLEAKEKNITYIPPFRLFNKQDYGYYKNDATRLETIFKDTKQTSIKLSDLFSPEYSEMKLKGLRRAFNVERQALEAKEYRVIIKENKFREHIQKKNFGRDNFDRLSRLIH